MKVFISWSGDRSRNIALALKDWIPCVLQSVQPFMSERDVVPGSGWLGEISSKLKDSQVGIICLTPESINRPWLNFEAGALTRELEGRTNLVIPYLHGFEEEKFTGPLSYFQAVTADQTGTLELVKTLNVEISRLTQFPLNDRVLNDTFDKWWPNLFNRLASLPKVEPAERAQVAESLGEGGPFSTFWYGAGKTLRRGNVFQDFRTIQRAKRGNVNAVQYLWADTSAGSEIQARIIEKESTLRVRFSTADDSYASNTAIRGKDESPLLNEPYRRYLIFGVRLCEEVPEQASPVSVAVRLVNGFLQHWVYGTGASSYICEPVENTSWKIVRVDLTDKTSWRRFESDGNPEGPLLPEFESVCSVILEVGIQGTNRPDRQGKGAIEIGPIVLLDNESDYSSFLPALSPNHATD